MAATMAANNMSWHIGNVRGRIASAGYGGGGTVWATENFAVGTSMGIDEIMAVGPPRSYASRCRSRLLQYRAGTAQRADGRTYYILQAAYVGLGFCGSLLLSAAGTSQPGGVRAAQPPWYRN